MPDTREVLEFLESEKKTVNKVKDGLYLFYVKDEQIFPIAIDEENWELLQMLGNTIAGNPIRVIDKPMGYVERWK